MTKGGASPGWSADGQGHWREAGELLQAGQYEKVAQFLHEAQVASEHRGDALLARVLAVTHRICLACSQCRAEGEWHRQGHEEAAQREHEFRQQLHTILELIGGRGTSEMREPPSAASLAGLSQPGLDIPKSAERVGLWRRIQALLERRTGLGSSGREAVTASLVKKEELGKRAPPSLVVYCLGPFRVYQDEQPVEDWPSSKGKCIFKYLITHRKRPVVKEVLMELFWPGAHPDAARNNLNVAIYGLRQALRKARPSFSHVLFQNDCYLLNPDLQIWIDCEAFMERFAAGQALERRGDVVVAMREYRAAEALYQGEFLEEDRYEDWPIPQRQRLHNDNLMLLGRLSRHYFDREDDVACAIVCRKMLAVDPCREEAHRRLMRCYSRLGQPHLSLRQYHLCVEALKEELDVLPTQKTTALYEQIRANKGI